MSNRHPDAANALRAVQYYRLMGRRAALVYVRQTRTPWRLYTLARVLDAAWEAGMLS